jgi:hypothetical protein
LLHLAIPFSYPSCVKSCATAPFHSLEIRANLKMPRFQFGTIASGLLLYVAAMCGHRIRAAYLSAILHQDIGWFDVTRTGCALSLILSDQTSLRLYPFPSAPCPSDIADPESPCTLQRAIHLLPSKPGPLSLSALPQARSPPRWSATAPTCRAPSEKKLRFSCKT